MLVKKKNGVLTKVDDKDIEMLRTQPKEFWKDVIEIGKKAFYRCKDLESITIPNGVRFIRDMAFSGCENLTSITISDNVLLIEEKTVYHCKNLESVKVRFEHGGIKKLNCDIINGVTISKALQELKRLEKRKEKKESTRLKPLWELGYDELRRRIYSTVEPPVEDPYPDEYPVEAPYPVEDSVEDLHLVEDQHADECWYDLKEMSKMAMASASAQVPLEEVYKEEKNQNPDDGTER